MARRQATRDEIVAAAWALAQENGLAGISLRDLGVRVNMRAQSIYTYFDSKFEIYDAMFAQGYREFASTVPALPQNPADIGAPDVLLRDAAYAFFDFCTANPVRFQLLFQRTIPGFEPSEESYRIALEVYASAEEWFRLVGITDPQALDIWTAMLTGLVDQQISNDPGGSRWRDVVDRSVDMYLASFAPTTRKPAAKTVGRSR